MLRSPVRRAAATLLALLFTLVVGEPVMLHGCPMHDGVPAGAGAAAGALAMDADHAAHAAHAAHGATAANPAPHGDGGDEAHQCQCLGHCAASAGAVPPVAQAVRWQVLVARRAEPPASEQLVARVAAPYLIPFANGPPRLA